MVGKMKKTPRSEQKTDTVYLHSTASSEWTPSISPDCLKMETLLRIMNIPYEHMDTEALTVTTNSQLPRIDVNGKEIPYTDQIAGELAKLFNKEITDDLVDNGVQRAFEALFDGRIHWTLIYMRATQANQLPPCDIFQGRLGHFLRPLASKVVLNKLKTKADHQGIGRQNAADVFATAKQDLRAISAYLSGKQFISGDEPNKLDATAFAHLVQFYFVPNDNELKTFIKEECPNIIDYLERMKNRYWSDWEEKCKPATPRKQKTSKDEQQPTEAVTGEKTEEKVEEKHVESGEETKKTESGEMNGASAAPTSTVTASTAVVNGHSGEKEQQVESTVEIVNSGAVEKEKEQAPATIGTNATE